MIKRIFYSIHQAWRCRKALSAIYRDRTRQTVSLLELNCEQLYAGGIRGLVLDFDGVMAWHDAIEPLPEVQTWLQTAIRCFGEQNIFILSNNPIAVRKAYFAEHYPKLRFVAGIRKKPYPDGVINISRMAQVPCSQLLVVDDRLLTGILAALLAGSRAMLVTQPYIAWRHATFQELFFWSLRKLERLLFG